MQQIDFPPLGRKVSCLGFGCARLDGRVGLRRSTELLETALELGITYFDVAASYGTAEEALGQVIGNSADVVVATKIGPPRLAYNARKMRIKSIIKPVLDKMRSVKILLRGAVTKPPQTSATRPRYDFSHSAIEQSLEQSLNNLRRDRADLFFAHEPHPDDLTPELEAAFQSLVDAKQIGTYGVGIGVVSDQWKPFGSVWQSGWPGENLPTYNAATTYVYHSLLRLAEQDRYGRTKLPVAELVASARRQSPDTVLLVSASTPDRLRQVVRAVEEAS